jgi:hypothetical protein
VDEPRSLSDARPARVVAVAAAGAVLGALALALWVASREWFSRDDFAFLAYVQLPERWSWKAAYLPLGERFWPFYRPLAMETYFWVGFRLFGLEAFGYFAVSLALHFAAGGLVFRLARRFGFDPTAALATAALAVTRQPSLVEIYWGSVFMYVGATALALLAAERFLARLAGGGLASQLASCAALLLALLCNEIAVTVPVALGLAAVAAGEARGLARLARALAPPAAIVAGYGAFRFGLLAPASTTALYAPELGAHVPANAAVLAREVLGGGAAAIASGALAAGALAALAAGRARPPDALRWLARVGGACLAWSAAVLLPFALLPFPQPRWAMNLEAPLCLALGALVAAARRALAPGGLRAFDAALAALLAASVPWSALVARGLDPEGALVRRLVAAIEAVRPPLPEAAPLVLLFGAPGLAGAAEGERLRSLAYGGGVLNAVDPGTRRVLRFHDLARRPGRNAVRPDSVYLVLGPDRRVEPAPPELLARELPRAVAAQRGEAERSAGARSSPPARRAKRSARR